ncbi:MAG: hypothetical protein PHW95_03945 [Patescibacteria group bacterium]|nr:hypothetical protein [Patescibacteria group bacterium]
MIQIVVIIFYFFHATAKYQGWNNLVLILINHHLSLTGISNVIFRHYRRKTVNPTLVWFVFLLIKTFHR